MIRNYFKKYSIKSVNKVSDGKGSFIIQTNNSNVVGLLKRYSNEQQFYAQQRGVKASGVLFTDDSTLKVGDIIIEDGKGFRVIDKMKGHSTKFRYELEDASIN